MQLKSLMVTSNASNPQWLLASKFSNRCRAQMVYLDISWGSGGLTMAHLRQVPYLKVRGCKNRK